MILLPRLTSSIEMLELLLYHHCEKFVNSWVVMPFLNNRVVNLNLHRSCKVGLRRMLYLCEFIARIWLLVTKLGGCSKKLIPSEIFPIFSLKFCWIFR
jgi:hypothetical protein